MHKRSSSAALTAFDARSTRAPQLASFFSALRLESVQPPMLAKANGATAKSRHVQPVFNGGCLATATSMTR
jgi:hypothetical protein